MLSVRQLQLVAPSVAFLFIWAFLVSGCGSEANISAPVVVTPEPAATASGQPGDSASDPDLRTNSISFSTQIQPIIERSCAQCHTGNEPGTQHLVLETADQVSLSANLIAAAAETRYMPPWPSSPLSPSFHNDWSLSDAEIELIALWAQEGGQLDGPRETAIAALDSGRSLDAPDVIAQPAEAFAAESGVVDIYQCLVYDPQLTAAQSATAIEFRPDQTEVVHHAIAFVVDAEDRALIADKDAATPEAGWECAEFRPSPTARDVFAWAPGQGMVEFGGDAGVSLEPGSFFVLQTHYHYEDAWPADQSSLSIKFATDQEPVQPITVAQYVGPAEIPCHADEQGPLCARDAVVARDRADGTVVIQADMMLQLCGVELDDIAVLVDGVASSSCDSPARQTGRIVAVFGHMHELGTSIRLTINPDTADERILLDIPQWRFDWQLNYRPVDLIELSPTDVIRIECSWDRDLRDPTLDPEYVYWSEGTDDEMCYSTITTVPVS